MGLNREEVGCALSIDRPLLNSAQCVPSSRKRSSYHGAVLIQTPVPESTEPDFLHSLLCSHEDATSQACYVRALSVCAAVRISD